MRVASFNLESLEPVSRTGVGLQHRAEILRPQLERLRADILCLQEVNAQKQTGHHQRRLDALDELLKGTAYETYARAVSSGPDGNGPADVHNLVTLCRYPIMTQHELRHGKLPAVDYRRITAAPADVAPYAVSFDRPILCCEVDAGAGRRLTVFNVHLRAPLATAIPGQKESAFVWKSSSAWAEGYFLSSLKRAAQALELRLAVDEIFDRDEHAHIVVCGDFNAEDHDTPLDILMAAEEDTGNGLLAHRSLVTLDRSLPHDRRFSVLHHGRPQMLDHILVSRPMLARFAGIEAHNETLADELVGYAKTQHSTGSYHAPIVAAFAEVAHPPA